MSETSVEHRRCIHCHDCLVAVHRWVCGAGKTRSSGSSDGTDGNGRTKRGSTPENESTCGKGRLSEDSQAQVRVEAPASTADVPSDGHGTTEISEPASAAQDFSDEEEEVDAPEEENGFLTVRELPMVYAVPKNVAAYSMPLEAIMREPRESEIVNVFKSGGAERMIACNVELSDEEQIQMKRLRDLARARGVRLIPSIAANAPRFLGEAKGDHVSALDSMVATQEWRYSFFADGPIRDHEMLEDLQSGVVYFTGRDSALRPALVVRPSRLTSDQVDPKAPWRLTRLLVFCMEYFARYMMIPGRVESVCVVLDLLGITLAHIPRVALPEIHKALSRQPSGRVARFYVCHMPRLLNVISSLVQAQLTEKQRFKIMFVRRIEELAIHFAAHQLEKSLGGCRPNVTKFYPFPLEPGPFAARSTAMPNADAERGLHQALSPAGRRGRLWDTSKSKAENSRIEFGPKAEKFPVLRPFVRSPSSSRKTADLHATAQHATAQPDKELKPMGKIEHPETKKHNVGIAEASASLCGAKCVVRMEDDMVGPLGCFRCVPRELFKQGTTAPFHD